VVPAFVETEDGLEAILARMPNLGTVINSRDQSLAFFARQDQQSRPLYAKRVPCSQLLVRIRRSEEQQVHVSVEGIVDAQWSFDTLADYQLEAAKRPKLELVGTVGDFVDGYSGTLLPPVWAAVPHPSEFQLFSSSKEKKRQRSLAGVWKISWEDKTPDGPARDLPTRRQKSAALAERALADRLSEMFKNVRPVLSVDLIRLLLAREGQRVSVKDLMRALPLVAYTFKQGAFFRLWIRYGYDVRKDPVSRFFQAYIYRPASAARDLEPAVKAAKAPTTKSGSKKLKVQHKDEEADEPDEDEDVPDLSLDLLERQLALHSAIPVTMSMCTQLCDIAFEPVRSLVYKSSPTAMCDKTDGWFDHDVMEKIRKALVERKSALALEVSKKNEDLWPAPSFEELKTNPEIVFSMRK
jgi:hypothetical protein